MKQIKPMKATVPESLLNKITELEKELNLPEETIIQTALILGTSELKKWVKWDD